ncbi:MAG: globin-coupled sensor protein [Kurthia sp.]|nr:globin-coupled sensor protein [Candidatus Kurthia equi]
MFFLKQKEIIKIENNDLSHVGIFLDDREVRLQTEMIDLQRHDLCLIANSQKYFIPHISDMVDGFYEAVGKVPHLTALINEKSSIARLRQTLNKHITQMLSGRIDDPYVEARRIVGRAHLRINLYPKWYLGAFQKLEFELRQVIIDMPISIEDKWQLTDSIGKLCNFEQQLVLDEYDKYSRTVIKQQQEEIKQRVREDLGSISSALEAQAVQTSEAVDELMKNTIEVEKNIHMTIKESEATKQASKGGFNQMLHLSTQTTSIHDKTNEMSAMVQDLDNSSSEMKDVIEMVKSIANQTNLLALNSAIEAARAGEHGKGFAVVAEEVRKLADQTKTSVEQIAVLIEESTVVTTHVVSAINEIQTLVNEGTKQNNLLKESFDNISTSVSKTINDVESVGEQITTLSTIINSMTSASSELKHSAVELDQTIQTF